MNMRDYFTVLWRIHPSRNSDVLQDIHDLVDAAEYGIAFEHLCSWIYEDDLRISAQYYERLKQVADEMAMAERIEPLQELIAEAYPET